MQLSSTINTFSTLIFLIATKIILASNSHSLQQLEIRKHNQVQLRCDAFGNEPLSIEWYKNKQRLSNDVDPRFTIHNKPVRNGLISILVIKSAQRQDNSMYECITRNSVGKDRLPIKLIVQEEPDNIQEMKVTQINSRSVVIEWTVPYDGKSPITSYMFQYKKAHQQDQPVSELPTDQLNQETHQQPFVMYASAFPTSNNQFQATSDINSNLPSFSSSSLSSSSFSSPSSSSSSLSSSSKFTDDDWQLASQIMLPVQANSSNSGDFKTLTIEKLEPSTRYVLRALAINGIGQSKFSQPLEFTSEEDAPDTSPRNIKAQAVNSTSIQVSWDVVPRVSRIHGYYVGYRIASFSSSSTKNNTHSQTSNNFVYKPYLTDQRGSRLEYTINDLRRDTVYELTVAAFNGRGTGPTSDFVLAKTIEMEPPKPVKIQIRRESNDSIFIEWSRDPTDQNPIDDYVLYQEKNFVSQEWTQVRLPGTQTQYKAPGLKCGTRYQFYIVAHNKVGKSLHSEVVGASTSGALPVIPSKSSLIEVVNSTCLLVKLNSFQDNGCRIRTFTIQYRAEKNSMNINQHQIQPHPLTSAANGLAVQHQALTALTKSSGASSITSLGSSSGSVVATSSTSSALASGTQTSSEWITVKPKVNPKLPRSAEEDTMEYICNLSPTGEYTIHVSAQNDVGRSEIEYTVLMSSDELRHSLFREVGHLLWSLPNVFAYIPSLIVFLLAGLFVSLASLILYTSVVKYYQKFVIMHNQIRASRRAKRDEKRRRKLMNSSVASGRHSQKMDLWADEFYDDEDEVEGDDGIEADGDDEAVDEDENSSSSGFSGSVPSKRQSLGRRQQRQQQHRQQQQQQNHRHSMSGAHLQFVNQQKSQRVGHYESNIGAFDSSSIDSPCHNSGLGKQCYNNGSSCISTASTDSIQGRFQCLNSKQFVKMNEYTMLPSISASLSPPRASDIYGTTTGPARPSPHYQLPVLNAGSNGVSEQQVAASSCNNNPIYYSTLRRSNMQTYLPLQRRSSAANIVTSGPIGKSNQPATTGPVSRPSQNIADIYGYYADPHKTGGITFVGLV